MAETRRKFDRDFRDCAVRLVRETGKPIAQVTQDLGIKEGTLGNWSMPISAAPATERALDEDERAAVAAFIGSQRDDHRIPATADCPGAGGLARGTANGAVGHYRRERSAGGGWLPRSSGCLSCTRQIRLPADHR